MMASTTSSSIRVKPRRRTRHMADRLLRMFFGSHFERTRLAMDHEHDFASAVVIHAPLQLGTDLTRLEYFQGTRNRARARREFGGAVVNALRTDATIHPSAHRQDKDTHRLPGFVFEMEDHQAFLADGA